MSSCHREDQGERPPGVRNALFFPVVFRKAVINLIPSSSLPTPRRGGEGGREGGREAGRAREGGGEGGDAENRKRMGHSVTRPKWCATNETKGEEKRMRGTGWFEL